MTTMQREQLADQTTDDSRLAEALTLLAREPISVLSLDVFDTLVWRLVAEPADAFVLLGHRLRDGGHLADHVSAQLFSALRSQAERRARGRVGEGRPSHEVSLEEVYAQMSPKLFSGSSPSELVGLEVELERDIAFPDLEVVKLARLAHECGVRVVLVSDTYYSGAQLRRILDREPFSPLPLSDVLSSSEHTVGKATGLYEVVLEQLGVEPEEVLHVGDNADSDVAFPAKLGIRALHYEKYPAGLRTVLEREGVVGDTDPTGRRPAAVHPTCGDFGLTALRSKAAFRAERAEVGPGRSPYWAFGASVLGPVFTGFAEWVHSRARAEGVDTVHCIMREGRFLARLVNGARGYLSSPVRAEPLWLSRDLCARAAILEANSEELTTFVSRRRPPSLRQFCDTLGIGLAQLPEVASDGEGRLDDHDLLRRTLESVARQPDVQAAIVTGSALLRERLVDYFVKTVGADTERVVLADLGWGGTIQSALDRALSAAGVQVETVGLYLLTNHAVLDRALSGVRAEGFLAEGGIPDSVKWIIRSPEIIEQVCMTDAGSLVDFTSDGEPVCGPVGQSAMQMLQRSAVQLGVVGFQRQWARYADVVPAGDRALDHRARGLLLQTLLRFVISPTREEAAMFGVWSHDDNYGTEASEAIISGDDAALLKYMTPRQLPEIPMSKVYWPFGLAALYNPSLALATTAVLEGVLPEEAFAPGEDRQVTIVPAVEHIPRRGVRVGVRPNWSGLCYVRREVLAEPLLGVNVEFGDGPGVVRLDRMTLAFSLRGRPDPLKVALEWPDDFEKLEYQRCARLGPNVLYGARHGPRLVYRCPREWGLDAYKVEVELAFAWLVTSPPRGAPGVGRVAAAQELLQRVQARARAVWRSAEQGAADRSLDG